MTGWQVDGDGVRESHGGYRFWYKILMLGVYCIVFIWTLIHKSNYAATVFVQKLHSIVRVGNRCRGFKEVWVLVNNCYKNWLTTVPKGTNAVDL